MLKTIVVVVAVLILTAGVIIKLVSLSLNKQKRFYELQKRVNEKQDYYKNKAVIQNLMEREEYIIKNNKISFLNEYIQLFDTKNSSKVININFSDILEVKKEYMGNVYQEFTGDKLWDGYAIVIVYTNANKISQKRICLKEGSKSMSDIVDSVAINTISNVIIEKIEDRAKK